MSGEYYGQKEKRTNRQNSDLQNTTQKTKQYMINTNLTKHFPYIFVKVTIQKVGIRSAVSKDGGARSGVISNYKRKQGFFRHHITYTT